MCGVAKLQPEPQTRLRATAEGVVLRHRDVARTSMKRMLVMAVKFQGPAYAATVTLRELVRYVHAEDQEGRQSISEN